MTIQVILRLFKVIPTCPHGLLGNSRRNGERGKGKEVNMSSEDGKLRRFLEVKLTKHSLNHVQ